MTNIFGVSNRREVTTPKHALSTSQGGFTLVEAVIASAILSTTMLIAALAFTTIVQLQQKGAAVRHVQQSTRYILETISRDIRNSDTYVMSSSGDDLLLPNGVNPKDKIRYNYNSSAQDVFRLRCRNNCTNLAPADKLARGQIRVVEFRMSYVDTNPPGEGSSIPPIRIYIRTQQLTDGISEEDPYFYEYETTALVVPRR